ncbi:MAG: DNA polymerase III subunit delta' [Anaerostipes sp.]|jgi:DNA polymerase-3 subunit delta'|nr:DNA polymerase III subunit delta' [Anaerostipes sp.]MDD3745624.1 DNA polymerase III subunit delta' [Anaerostipes sp.]
MKSFERIIGHKNIVFHFEEAVRSGKISHAYLLSGEKGSGKKTVATAFAKALLCEHHDGCGECQSCLQIESENHPDLIYVKHEKYDIRVDDIREQVNGTIFTKPYSSPYKIYIIDDAERMNQGASNALLKTLEEPPEYAIILLLANNKDKIMDTIQSRCVSMALGTIAKKEMMDYLLKYTDASKDRIEFCVDFSLGNLGKAKHYLVNEKFFDMMNESLRIVQYLNDMEIYEVISYLKSLNQYREEIYDFLDILTAWYRDVLMLKTTGSVNHLIFKDKYTELNKQEIYVSFEGITHILDEISKTRVRLDANVNFDVALELLLLTIKENGKVW